MPVVSVVIPLYNKGYLVARALDSVFAQTLQDFEILVVDDGSTDNGPDIVRQYKDPRLNLIQQPNAGPGAARNKGVKSASAIYIAFLDADDEWLPEFLQTSLANLKDNPDCVLNVVNHYRGKDKTLASTLPAFHIGISQGQPWQLPINIKPQKMLGSLFYLQSGGTVTCRRDTFLHYGGSYEKQCTWGEDQYLWLQVLLNHKIYYDVTPLFWYHTEDSELNIPNRHLPGWPFPFLINPEPIRKNCPVQYRLTLERFLVYMAMLEFIRMVGQDDLSGARYLLQCFPSIKSWRWDFMKARIKVTFPWLTLYVRAIKRFAPGI